MTTSSSSSSSSNSSGSDVERPFRVIVVGSGVGGLVASSCLQKLGVDHVVLERHDEVAPAVGAGIAMWPQGFRVLSQLGYGDALRAHSAPLRRFQARTPNGRLVMDQPGFFPRLEENHGIGFYPFERRQFLQILYDGLPDKSFVKTGVAVEEVEHFPDRVEVKLNNGEIEAGDMILGVDGVHSLMRTKMWEHAAKTAPALITAKEKTSLRTEWKTLIVVTPAIPELGERDLVVTYNEGFTFLATSQPDAVYFFVIFRLDEPFTWPHRRRYTDADADALAELVADRPVTETLLFGEVWKRRTRAAALSLEEYVLEHWHHGRIVLAGDAAHKLHPNLAFGGNSAIEGVASLMNHLHRAGAISTASSISASTSASTTPRKPSATALARAFAAYQTSQRERLRQLVYLSNAFAKITTYATPLHRFLATWVMPLGDERAVADRIGWYVARAPRLEFLPSGVDGRGTRIRWGDGAVGGQEVEGEGEKGAEETEEAVGGSELEERQVKGKGKEREREQDELAAYKAIVDELAGLRTSSGATALAA